MIGKQRIPLNPDQVYLIPPNVHFSAHTDKVLTQLNINFQISSFSGLINADFYRIGMTPEIRRLIKLCRGYFEEKDIEILRLTGVALVSYCLTELPREMLREKETADSRIASLCSTLEGLYHEKKQYPPDDGNYRNGFEKHADAELPEDNRNTPASVPAEEEICLCGGIIENHGFDYRGNLRNGRDQRSISIFQIFQEAFRNPAVDLPEDRS